MIGIVEEESWDIDEGLRRQPARLPLEFVDMEGLVARRLDEIAGIDNVAWMDHESSLSWRHG